MVSLINSGVRTTVMVDGVRRSAVVFDKEELIAKSGHQLKNVGRDLQALVNAAVVWSDDARLNGRPLFSFVDYQKPILKRGEGLPGRVAVDLTSEFKILESKSDLFSIRGPAWFAANRQVAFTLLIWHAAELAGVAHGTPLSNIGTSRFAINAQTIKMFGGAIAELPLIRFKHDHLLPAIDQLNGVVRASAKAEPVRMEGFRSFMRHDVVSLGRGSDTIEAVAELTLTLSERGLIGDLTDRKKAISPMTMRKGSPIKAAKTSSRAVQRSWLRDQRSAEKLAEVKLAMVQEARLRAEIAEATEKLEALKRQTAAPQRVPASPRNDAMATYPGVFKKR
ncbi:hypothetical protein [Hansschlegelia sp. KR7-227]|uniref:hypothetical protein n=1 Tax=Hansschlegelia sp. KR7-227 TaxID=3400914 RepID=UPI003C0F8EE4